MWYSSLSSFSVGHLLQVVQKTVLNFLALSSTTLYFFKVFMILNHEVITNSKPTDSPIFTLFRTAKAEEKVWWVCIRSHYSTLKGRWISLT